MTRMQRGMVVTMVGDKALYDVFKHMPKKLQRSLVQKAARPGLQLIRKDAASLVRSIQVSSGVASQMRDENGRFLSVAKVIEKGGFGTRESIARAMKVGTRKPRRGVVGAFLRITYQRRTKNNPAPEHRASVGHLLEWGFDHRSGKSVKGHGFMTRAFEQNRARAEAMFVRVIQALIRDPKVKVGSIARMKGGG